MLRNNKQLFFPNPDLATLIKQYQANKNTVLQTTLRQIANGDLPAAITMMNCTPRLHRK
jgi:hypothetical protein